MVYELKAGGTTARVDSLGAQLISLMDAEGTEYIWQRDERYWSFCAPVLFPVVGRTKNGIIRVEGREYKMPKHGLVRKAEFSLAQQTEGRITLRYTSNQQTRAAYPFEFIFSVTFVLEKDRLTTTYTVENVDEKMLYFCIGGHPAFNVPLSGEEDFEDWELVFAPDEPLYSNYVLSNEAISSTQKDLIESKNGVVKLDRHLFDNDAMIFESVQHRHVQLRSSKTGRGVQVDFDDFPTLGIWSKGAPIDARFVCIEPWQGMGFRDDEGYELSEKKDILSLETGNKYEASFTVQVL